MLKSLALAIATLLLAGPASAALTVDSSAEGTGTSSTITWTHNPATQPIVGFVVVCTTGSAAPGDFISGAKRPDGTAMTQVGSTVCEDNGEVGCTEIYYTNATIRPGSSTECTVQNSPAWVHGVSIAVKTDATGNPPAELINGDQGQCTVTDGGSTLANPSCTISGSPASPYLTIAALFSGQDALASITAGSTCTQQQTHDGGSQTSSVETCPNKSPDWTIAAEDVAMQAIAIKESVQGTLGRWAYVGTIGSTSGWADNDTTVELTTTAAAEAGNVVICGISKDETGTGTTDGDNAQFTSFADSAGGNTWVEAGEFCNMQTSTAADGSCVAIYYSKLTNQINSSGTITATLSANTLRASMDCEEFTAKAATIRINPTLGVSTVADDNSLGGLQCITDSNANFGDIRERVYVHVIGGENRGSTGDIFPSVGFNTTNITKSDSGSAATSQVEFMEFQVSPGRRAQYPNSTANGLNSTIGTRARSPNTVTAPIGDAASICVAIEGNQMKDVHGVIAK